MRVLVQLVSAASVSVGGKVVGKIGPGLLLLVGVTHDDGEPEIELLAAKIANLRIFPDEDGQMNRSALDRLASGDPIGVLVVSQFTLYADSRKGRRPSFTRAAAPEIAAPIVDRLADRLAASGLPLATGRFGAAMAVSLVNDGPVTIWLDTVELRPAAP